MADSQTQTTTLRVRPLPAQNEHDEDLQTTVSQMHQAFKGFRNVTEQKLLDAIKNNGDAMDVVAGDIAKPEQQKGTLEYMAAKRSSMMQQLDVALNDTMMLLDFTSLLEATYKRQPAEQTISTFLKSAMPVGSLAAENWIQSSDKKYQKIKDDEQQKITSGWKAESLSKAADSLLSAANRLRDNIKHETQYWAHVLDVQEQGWTVFRSPVAKSQLAVQTSSTEAGAIFRERGLITLKAHDTGHIDLKSQTRELKEIQVQFKRDGALICSTAGLRQDNNDRKDPEEAVSVHSSLKLIRDSLFEEELFHEMNIEARQLVPFGVSTRHNAIHLDVEPQNTSTNSEILIELVARKHIQTVEQSTSTSARHILKALRLLLANLHQARLRRRSSKPPPMTLRPRASLTPRIVLPLLTAIRHYFEVQRCDQSLTSLCRVLENAGIPMALLRSIEPVESNAIDTTLMLRMTSHFDLTLPSRINSSKSESSSTAKIRLEITTQLVPGPDSPLGTSYHITLPADLSLNLYSQPLVASKRFQTTDLSSSMHQITNVLSKNVTYGVLAINFSAWAHKTEPWLRVKTNEDGISRDVFIYVQLSYDSEESDTSDRQITLNLYRSVASQASITEKLSWTASSKHNDLLGVVKDWIAKADI